MQCSSGRVPCRQTALQESQHASQMVAGAPSLQLVGGLQPYDPPVPIDKGPDLLQALTAESNESHGVFSIL